MHIQEKTGNVEVIPPDAMKDGTELSANKHILADVYGGDVTPTLEQMSAILRAHRASASGRRLKRKVSRPLNRWTMPVPYKFAVNDRKPENIPTIIHLRFSHVAKCDPARFEAVDGRNVRDVRGERRRP